MTPQELQSFLAIHGARSRIARDEVALQACVFCGNEKYNLEVNPARGVYHCWACGARGRAEQFLRDYYRFAGAMPVVYTPPAHMQPKELASGTFQPLTSDWAWNYLRARGLDPLDASIYEIGQGNGPNWDGRVVFSLKDYWLRTPVGYLGRAALPTVHPKYFAHWNDGRKGVTGYHSRSDVHVVVEGVFDGIKVHRAGFSAAVLGGVEERQVEEWAARLPSTAKVIIMLDGDAEAQAQKVYWRILPIHAAVKVCPLPVGLDPGVLEPEVILHLVNR